MFSANARAGWHRRNIQFENNEAGRICAAITAHIKDALFAERACGPVAGLAAKTQPALTQSHDLGPGHWNVCRHKGQYQIEDGGAGVHDAAGQAHDGGAVVIVAQQNMAPGSTGAP